MKDVLTPIEMRATDKNTEYNHIPTLVLMENAGSAIVNYIVNSFPSKNRVSIYSGVGGNGGDGFVIARHLLNYGYKVKLFLLARAERIKNEDSRINWESIKIIAQTDKNLKLSVISDSTQLKPDSSDIIVDALLGTGVNGKLRQPLSKAIDIINNAPAITIAVDIPSGLDPENGEVQDKCVVAHTTLTLHKKKVGLNLAQQTYTGNVEVLDIGIPRVAEEYVGRGDLLKLKKPLADSHKGQNGSILIVGSNRDYVGAVIFAAECALTQMLDLVYIVAPEESANIIKSYNPAFIVRSVKGDVLDLNAYDDIMEIASKVDSVLIGSGSGVDEKTGELFNRIVSELNCPIVLDADALKLVKKENLSGNVVLTPHQYEFEKFFDVELPVKQDDRINLLSELSSEYACVILLKGVVDIISSQDDYKLNKTGNSGMTIGGTGDLLAGLTTALSTQINLFDSACIASFLLGCAGDKVLEEKGFNYKINDILGRL